MKLCMNEAIYCLRAAGFTGEDLVIGGAVGMAESKLDTLAIGRVTTPTTENEDLGWMQISTKWHALRVQGLSNWRDPFVNAMLARGVWLDRQRSHPGEDPWNAWNTFRRPATGPAPFEEFVALATRASHVLWPPVPWIRAQVG
jgi:hypothetical protein